MGGKAGLDVGADWRRVRETARTHRQRQYVCTMARASNNVGRGYCETFLAWISLAQSLCWPGS